jgi:hypothetical protein
LTEWPEEKAAPQASDSYSLRLSVSVEGSRA